MADSCFHTGYLRDICTLSTFPSLSLHGCSSTYRTYNSCKGRKSPCFQTVPGFLFLFLAGHSIDYFSIKWNPSYGLIILQQITVYGFYGNAVGFFSLRATAITQDYERKLLPCHEDKIKPVRKRRIINQAVVLFSNLNVTGMRFQEILFLSSSLFLESTVC